MAATILFFVACKGNKTTDNQADNNTVNTEITEPTDEAITTDDIATTDELSEESKSLADALTEEETQETKAETSKKTTKKETETKEKKKIISQAKEVVKEVAKEKVKIDPVIEAPKEVVKETVAAVKPKPEPKAAPKPEPKPEPKEETPKVSDEMPPAPTKPALSHDKWDALLRKHVSSSGNVNYSGFKADKAQLQSYLEILSANTPESGWSRNKAMAYWINAYNAFTVKLIVDNYPVSSITDLEGGNPWKKRWISLGNQKYTLDQIEKEILLKKYKDARVHFAVNCAAKSCPALLNKAWTASNLESNFEKQTKAFINNSKFNDISAKSAKLSKLFDWYASDFGDVKTFINKYSSTQLKSNAKISFLEYDWKLNN